MTRLIDIALLFSIPAVALLLILIGGALERWARSDTVRMSCPAGHEWWVRRDDHHAHQGRGHCPWCRRTP